MENRCDHLTERVNSVAILGMRVDVTSLEQATEFAIHQSLVKRKGYVCAANVHMCMEAYYDKEFQQIVNAACMVVPDGKPLSWWMHAFGVSAAQQVRGPDLFESVCRRAAERGISVGLYGGTQEVLDRLQVFFKNQWPTLEVACAISPPFRELSPDEQNRYSEVINDSGARILFVGLGCPKQEKWMACNEYRISAVMIGVGAAFDFYAGTKKIAPVWIRKMGMEWLHRLISEPGRLWVRYLKNNPLFMFHFMIAWAGERLRRLKRRA